MNMHRPANPCFGKSELFDATDLYSHARAKELCGTCPVIDGCRLQLRDAQRDQIIVGYGPEGTWAGVLLRSTKAGAA